MTRDLRTNKRRGLYVEVGENFNAALRKFKKKVDESGLLMEVLKRQAYEKPTTAKKRKKGAAKARWRKQLLAQQLPKKNY